MILLSVLVDDVVVGNKRRELLLLLLLLHWLEEWKRRESKDMLSGKLLLMQILRSTSLRASVTRDKLYRSEGDALSLQLLCERRRDTERELDSGTTCVS